MSTPARRVRQPGRTAQPYDPGNCGVCDKMKGNPSNAIGMLISGTGSCCSLSLDFFEPNYLHLTSNGTCTKGAICAWEGTFNGGGVYVHVGLTLECVGGVPTLNLSITRTDVDGNYIETLADGSYATTAYGTCDNCDCEQLINNAGGALTVYNNGVCNPSFCTTPLWSIGTASVSTCPQPAAKGCCCGGRPAILCTDCCTGGHTQWDVDFTGVLVVESCGGSPFCGGCFTSHGFLVCDPGTLCDEFPQVYTLANSSAGACVWKYTVALCPGGVNQVGAYIISLAASPNPTDPTKCNWALNVYDPDCNKFVAAYSASRDKGDCSAMTLTGTGGAISSSICQLTFPPSITISPA